MKLREKKRERRRQGGREEADTRQWRDLNGTAEEGKEDIRRLGEVKGRKGGNERKGRRT